MTFSVSTMITSLSNRRSGVRRGILATCAWWGAAGLAVWIGTAALTPVVVAQQPQRPGAASESLVGSDSFARYCVSCHGPAGKGDGILADVLKVKPADLTQLAQRAGGTFPTEHVRAVVGGYGNPLAAHKRSDMPLWGPIFHSLDPSETRVTVRVENLVRYIEKLQAPTSRPQSLGAQLFATHCAACHGRDGRGGGTVASELRHTPPDLTRFTSANGGVFPRKRLADIIDGRYPAAHGTRDMPVWGNAFSRSGEGATPAQVAERIDAILDYLQAIQARGA